MDRIPVTSVARTLVDLAGVLSERGLSDALNEAEIAKVLDVSALRRVMAESPGRHGIGNLRQMVDRLHPLAGSTRSILEIEFVGMVSRLGLVPPLVNETVEGYEVDMAWPDWRLIVELDSRGFHDTARGFEQDRERSAHLELAGWRVLRLTWDMVTRRRRETERKLLAFGDLASP
jgi:hypothetical protein